MNAETKRGRILIIDDDQGVLKLVETLLGAQGYNVSSTNDAARGLEMAIRTTPDLVVLDVMMPIINGFNICRLLKSQEIAMRIPVILLTSRTSEEDFVIGQEVGANAYLPKPIDTKLFLEKVRELLSVAG
ncbi:MAG TPA: response regulator [Candidatus Omnitrophota bacterium]|jgi:DNA-binding response OmpR family regulator|nr:response regulator [Candidatus Omnitrophota bacterium]HPN55250.1 response regulator [Candidatus Omnitrophota bacterium]